jgi:hypothetical protein
MHNDSAMTQRPHRRRSAAIVMTAALVLVLGACDWTTFRGGPGHTGSVTEGILAIDNVADLQPQWRTG